MFEHSPTYENKEAQNPREIIGQALSKARYKANRILNEEYGLNGDFLDEEDRISMPAFDVSKVISKEIIDADNRTIRNLEAEFAGYGKSDREALYRKTHRKDNMNYREDLPPSRDEMIEAWQIEKSKSKPELLEKIMTLILQKALGERFLVVRSSVYDDYVNGCDHLIIDRETGEVVCAFDELSESRSFILHDGKIEKTESGRWHEKMAKVLEISKFGGTKIKYGLQPNLKTGAMDAKNLYNLPIFFLPVQSENLNRLLSEIDKAQGFDGEALSPTEKKILLEAVDAVLLQIDNIESKLVVNHSLRSSLEHFQKILKIIEVNAEKTESIENKLDLAT